MRRVLLLGLMSALVLGLASTGQASLSHFMVSGSMSQTGFAPQFVFPANSFGPWSKSVSANDLVADGLSVTDSGSLVKEWTVGWATAEGFSTVYTVNYTVTPDLFTEIVGDWASGNATVKLELLGVGSSQDVVPLYAADGGLLSDPIIGSVAVSTPAYTVGGDNAATLKLTVSLNAEAFKAAPPVIPEPPVVPVPGAIALSSLGACLIGWLRRNRAL